MSVTYPNFHLLCKPAGPACNLACEYCFYLEKEQYFEKGHRFRMSDETLEAYVKQYISAQEAPQVNFSFQGGEPTLMGLGFFRKLIKLVRQHNPDNKEIVYSMQTNGTLLDDEWCEFLHEHNFLMGLSIDGPQEITDRYRKRRGGQGSYKEIIRGLELLKKHNVEFNTLSVVNDVSSQHPVEVYRFLKDIGSRYMQFIPIVERPDFSKTDVYDWSVKPEDYGDFLIGIYDHWISRDVGRYYVQAFDVSLGIWAGNSSSLCVYSEICGNAGVAEHNGDIYSCDHFVYPQNRLGNLFETPLKELMNSEQQIAFGHDKKNLPRICLDCDYRFVCNGGCPKERFIPQDEGQPMLNYLCAGYKKFFAHISPTMKQMVQLLRQRRTPAEIMQQDAPAGRNAPCPCGSGKKFKNCCALKDKK